jgi:hypothetical protein
LINVQSVAVTGSYLFSIRDESIFNATVVAAHLQGTFKQKNSRLSGSFHTSNHKE